MQHKEYCLIFMTAERKELRNKDIINSKIIEKAADTQMSVIKITLRKERIQDKIKSQKGNQILLRQRL